MRPGLRRFALAIHLTVSVGWIGAVAAYLALDVTVATSHDATVLRGAYLAMDVIVRTVVVPLAIGTLLTGLLMSLGTAWGLLRHYWVLLSFLLTVVATTVLLVETRVVRDFADIAKDPTTSPDSLRALGGTLVHSIGGTIVLLVILVLNVYKPNGLTRYGWRRQQQARREQLTRRRS